MKVFGYARVSTPTQSLERQRVNILKQYPDAIVFEEEYTGTKIDRPVLNKLMKHLHKGDVLVFDEVSRLARNAEEGFKTYKALYERGVTLAFLKESTLNTENFRKAEAEKVQMTGTDVDIILKAVNEYMLRLAENQIKAAFETAQHEVDFLHQRTKEGIAQARLRGSQIGGVPGKKLKIKKSDPIKRLIRRYSKDFDGTLSDADVMSVLNEKNVDVQTDKSTRKVSAHLSRNTYYRYKRELRMESGSHEGST